MADKKKKQHDENGEYTYDEETRTKTYEREDRSKRVMKDFQRQDDVYDANGTLRYHKVFLQYVSLNGNGKSGADNDITYYSEDGKTSLHKGYNNAVLQYETKISDQEKVNISTTKSWGNFSSYKYESGKNTIYAEGSKATTAFYNDTHLEYKNGVLKEGTVIVDWKARSDTGINPKVTFDEKGKPEKMVSRDGTVAYKDGKVSSASVNGEPSYTVKYDKDGNVSSVVCTKKGKSKELKPDSKKGKEAIEKVTAVVKKADNVCAKLQEEATNVANKINETLPVAKNEIAKLNADIEAHPELYPIPLSKEDRETTRTQFKVARKVAEAEIRAGVTVEDSTAKRIDERIAKREAEKSKTTQTPTISKGNDGR